MKPQNNSDFDNLLKVVASRQTQFQKAFSTYLPNPDEILKKLGRGVDAYEILKDDPHISSCIQSRKSGVMSLLWDIDRGFESNTENEFIKDILKNLNTRQIINDILDAPAIGYMPLEINWQLNAAGNIIPVSLIGKPPEWFSFDDNNLLRYHARGSFVGEIPHARKFIVASVNPTYKNPYGDGFLKKCYWSWTFKKGGLKFWVKFTEKYGMPWAYGKVPRNIEDSEKEELLDMLAGLGQDGNAVFPDDVEVGTVDASKASSPAIYEGLAHFCNSEISKVILSQTLTTEQGDTGSYAMSQTHLEVRKDVIDADKLLVEDVFNTLIKWTLDFNFDIISSYPKFELYSSVDVDKSLAERDVMLWNSGWIKPTQEYLDKAYGFEPDEMLVIEKIVKKGVPAESDTPETSLPFAEDESNKGVASLTDIVIDDATAAINKSLEPLALLIERAETFEEIEKGALKLYPTLNDKELQKVISKATIVSKLGGKIEVNNLTKKK